MAIIVGDRVLETSTTSGTGTLTLAGAGTGYQSFTVGIGVGNQTYYTIFDPTANTWEVGIGTLLTGTTLSRTTVFSNSSGTTALISFAANSKNVFCTSPASKYVDQSDVGIAPNQIPLNQYLGSMAYQDNNGIQISGGTSSNLQNLANLFVAQPTPSAINASATLTVAQLLTIIITTNSVTAVAFTLPTGTLTDAGILGGLLLVNQSFDWTIINTGSAVGIVTVSGGTANTLVGSGVLAITTSATFRTVKTATNTFITYRIA